MNIGEPKRTIEIEPVVEPLPAVPVAEPAPEREPEAVPAEPARTG